VILLARIAKTFLIEPFSRYSRKILIRLSIWSCFRRSVSAAAALTRRSHASIIALFKGDLAITRGFLAGLGSGIASLFLVVKVKALL